MEIVVSASSWDGACISTEGESLLSWLYKGVSCQARYL